MLFKRLALPETWRLRRAMRRIGALSPETALPTDAFNDILVADIDPYLDAGILREGPTGSFYLDEPMASGVIRRQTVIAVIFLFVVVIIPILW